MAHEPVLAEAVADLLVPVLGAGVFVDATLGRGGHTRRVLEGAPACRAVGIDRDGDALEESGTNLAAYRDRMVLVRANFEELAAVLERLGIASVRGVLLDLGVSSPQLDRADRGFSFRSDGPLDMRMDLSQDRTAADVVNTYEERTLARVIARYGEERFAGRIARRIVAARPVTTTAHLAEVVADAIPQATRRHGPHPARRTFQALRIEVNDELTALERVLPQAHDALEPGGRVVLISYHSLEDRLVKRFFAAAARDCICPPDFPVCRCDARATLRVITRRPVRPSADELERNPRAAAAKLRAAERLAVNGAA